MRSPWLLVSLIALAAAGAAARSAEDAGADQDAAATTADRRTPITTAVRRGEPLIAGFTNSAHDFFGPDAAIEQRCAPCHPAPAPTGRAFDWEPGPAAPGPMVSAQPDFRLAASTALCLSCHDGMLAGTISAGRSAGPFAENATVHGGGDHPVGVRYPASGRLPGRFRREYAPLAKLAADGAIRLPEGRVECISCHDPHNARGHSGLLVKSDRRSALCLSCHVK